MSDPTPPRLLHVGCGGDSAPEWAEEFQEVRLDISPENNPDVLASMTDMGDIGEFDSIYCSHALEHLMPHDVGVALGEFLRVLKAGAYAVVAVPDLEDVRPTEDVLYVSPCGPITGLDLMYGLRSALKERPFMAHRTGFTAQTLEKAFVEAGFSQVHVKRMECFNLLCIAVK